MMLSRSFLVLLCGVLLLALPGCKGKQTPAEKRAADEKNFRIRQKQMAAKAYNDLVKNYPESEFAEKAQQRLNGMGPIPATPSPKKK